MDVEQDELTLSANAQLATFVLSLVVLDAIERVGIEPTLCAGHSLGEYTALAASGALGFEEGVRLVVERGEAMHNAAEEHPGTMAAVMGADDDAVDAACQRAEGEVWVANYNAPGQVVIAGTAEAVARAGAIAKELGARKVMPIPVAGAFHTMLMAPARSWLRKSLASTAFSVPEIPVVANVDARAHTAAEDWPGLLSAQLCSPVRWRQSLETLAGMGATRFVEVGPGGVLTGLARRTLPDALASAVATPDDLDTLVNAIAGSETWNAYAAAHQGEHLYTSERVVISPCGRACSSPSPGWPRPGPGALAPDGTDVPARRGRPRGGGRPPRHGGRGRGPHPFAGHRGGLPGPSRRARGGGRARRLAARAGRRRVSPPGAVITGWGTALPDTVVTNADLEARLDTTDEWIVDALGHPRAAHRRARCRRSPSTPARRALERAGAGARQVDLLVLATCTPDLAVPATSAAVHYALGLSGGAFDVNAACAGFVYALVAAHGAVSCRRRAPGAAHRRRLRVAASPTPTTAPRRCSSPTAPGAVVLEASDDDGLLAVDLGVDGSAHDLLTCAHGGYMEMEGKEVFRRAVRITVESASNALERAKLTPDDIALFVPHQANLRIIEAAAARLGIPMDRVAVVVDRTGQHLERLGPPGARRRRRRRPTAARGPRPHVGVRRRDDVGQHRGALGRRAPPGRTT